MKSGPEKENASEGRISEALSEETSQAMKGINMSDSKALIIGTTSVRQVGDLYSLNDLHKAADNEDKHQPAFFMRREETQALVGEISKSADSQNYEPVKSVRGKYGGTYACKELVIAYAAWISAAFHLKVIRVFLEATALVRPAQQTLPLESDLHQAVANLSKQVALLSRQVPTAIELIPVTQSKEISTRLDRLGKLFHPFSDQFSDVLGISRALRGLDPRMGVSKAGWIEVLPKITA